MFTDGRLHRRRKLIIITVLIGVAAPSLWQGKLSTDRVQGYDESCVQVCDEAFPIPCNDTLALGMAEALETDATCIEIWPGNWNFSDVTYNVDDLEIRAEDPDNPPTIYGWMIFRNAEQLSLKNLRIVYDAQGGSGGGGALGVEGSKYVSVQHLTTEGATASGMRFSYGQNIHVSESISKNNGHQGIDLDSVDGAWVDENHVENNGDGGIGISNYVSRCYGSVNTLGLWDMCWDQIRCVTFPTSNIFVTHNTAKYNYKGIHSDGGAGILISGNTVLDSARAGIEMQNTQNVFIFDNDVSSNVCSGISIYQSDRGEVDTNDVNGHVHEFAEWANAPLSIDWNGVTPDLTFECSTVPCYNAPPANHTPPGGCSCTPVAPSVDPTPGGPSTPTPTPGLLYVPRPVPGFRWIVTVTPGSNQMATANAGRATAFPSPGGVVLATVTPTPTPQ